MSYRRQASRINFRYTLAAVMVLLLAFALRIHGLGAKSIWWDEAHSWWYAAMPLGEGIREGMAAWHGAAGDPFFTIALHVWMRLVGQSALALRYLSLLINVITAAYLGRIVGRLAGRRTGLVALSLGAVAAIWVFYSQEIRQYTLTPAIMLVMVDAVLQLAGGCRPARGWQPWIQLVTGQVLALYTHSFMVFGLVGVNLWLGWVWLRRDRRQSTGRWLTRWVICQIASLLLLLPTLPNYLRRAQAGHNPFVEPLSIPHILNAQWAFLMGIPWERATDLSPVRFIAVGLLIGLLIGLGLGMRGQAARALRDLIWLVSITVALATAYWTFNPIIHPRYLIFLSGPLLIVWALVLAQTWKQAGAARAVSAVLAAGIVASAFLSIHALYAGSAFGYRHDPSNRVADLLRRNFGAEDGIISIDPNDYSLSYYDIGQAPLFRAGLDDGTHSPSDLVAFIAGRRRIAVVDFHAQRSDKRGIIPFYLERYGDRIDENLMESYGVYTYQIDSGQRPALVRADSALQRWPGIHLTGQSIQAGSAAVTVMLSWQTMPGFTADARYASIVRLVDPVTGWVLSTATGLLLSDSGEPTSEWAAGQQATQYFVLPLYPGTPSLDVAVQVWLVDSATGHALDRVDASGAPAGQNASLGVVKLADAPGRWVYNDHLLPFALLPVGSAGVQGYTLDWPSTVPGGEVALTLQWTVAADAPEVKGAWLELIQNGRVLAVSEALPLQGRPPAPVVPWLDRRVLSVSREAAPGPTDLVLVQRDSRVVLGQIDVLAYERQFDRPMIDQELEVEFNSGIRLLGYRLQYPDRLTSAEEVLLTLYWQAAANGNPEQQYVVFTHILDSTGRLIGQHDGVPVYGTRPTGGWLAGEYLIDEHPLVFREAYTGSATIQVGLYDPDTLERVPTLDGADAVPLPVMLKVESLP